MLNQPLQILLINHNRQQRQAAALLLQRAGYAVVEAETGAEGLHVAKQAGAALVIAEANLPDMKGVTLCQRVKEEQVMPDCLVALISGDQIASTERAEAYEAGADGYIVRPVSDREFLARVQALLRVKKEEKSLHQRQTRMSLALDFGVIGLWDWDIIQDRVYADRRMAIFFGLEPLEAEKGFPISTFINAIHPEDRARVTNLIDESVASGQPYTAEYRIHSDNQQVWVAAKGQIEQDENGRSVRFLGAISDITEQKLIEEKLQESERQLATLMSNLPGMAYRCLNDKHWTMQFVSKGCLPLTGYKPDELLHNRVVPYGELIHPDDREKVRQTVQSKIQKDQPFQVSYRLRTRGGAEKWVWEQGRQVSVPEMEQPMLEGLITDITQKVQAETALSKSEERFKRALQNIPDVVVIYDSELKIQYINNATQQVTGRPPSDYIGKREEEIWPPEVYETYLPALKQAAATLEVCAIDTELALPNNQKRFLRITCVPISDDNGELREILGITQDFTGREQARRSLQESVARWESLVQHAPYFVAIMDQKGILHYVNHLQPGYHLEDVIGSSNNDYIDPRYHEMVKQKVQHVFESRQSVTYEIEAAGEHGAKVWYETRVSPLILDDEVAFVTMISLDITERKQAEAAIRESNAHMEEAQAQAKLGSWTLDPATQTGTWSKEMFRLFNVDPPYITPELEEMMHFIDANDRERILALHEQLLQTGEPFETEFRTNSETGPVRVLYVKAHAVSDDHGNVSLVAGITQDITEQYEVERRLRQSEQQLSIVFNNNTDLQLLWAVEPDGEFRTLAINQPYIETARNFGINISEEAFVGATLPEAFAMLGLGPDMLHNTIRHYRRAADSGEPVYYPETIKLEAGTYHSEITLTPVLDDKGQCRYILFNSHDVTELKVTAEELQKLNTDLDERVRQRTADLNQMVQLMAGREVRMAELKKVIKTLRKQLQDAGMEPEADDPLFSDG